MSFDHFSDIINSREVIERIAELEALEERDDLEATELVDLLALATQGADYCPDWEYGEALVRDSYFATYAQELADDIGAIPVDVSWPLTCIDWAQAARELQMDYTALDFRGVTYWAR